ncbi:MAG: type II toxin-antitoxin system HicB family antitoxin [Anaerolineales bacterium]|nr:type II toxin-antitoxin system HicB family antitoxin [Anaerolineales bacterium]
MSKQKVFTVIGERDPESGWLVGEVAELPGCYTQAPDLPGLEKNIHEAIVGYLDAAGPREPAPEFVGTFHIGVSG